VARTLRSAWQAASGQSCRRTDAHQHLGVADADQHDALARPDGELIDDADVAPPARRCQLEALQSQLMAKINATMASRLR